MEYEIIYEIIRRKFNYNLINKYSKIICSIEEDEEGEGGVGDEDGGEERQRRNRKEGKERKNKIYNLVIGTRINRFYLKKNKQIKLNIFVIDGSFTIFIGYCYLSHQQEEQGEDEDEEERGSEIKVSYIVDSNEIRIGKLFYTSTICKLYSEKNKSKKVTRKSPQIKSHFFEGSKRETLPSFRFQRLGKQINWDRIQSLNIERFTDKKLSFFSYFAINILIILDIESLN